MRLAFLPGGLFLEEDEDAGFVVRRGTTELLRTRSQSQAIALFKKVRATLEQEFPASRGAVVVEVLQQPVCQERARCKDRNCTETMPLVVDIVELVDGSMVERATHARFCELCRKEQLERRAAAGLEVDRWKGRGWGRDRLTDRLAKGFAMLRDGIDPDDSIAPLHPFPDRLSGQPEPWFA